MQQDTADDQSGLPQQQSIAHPQVQGLQQGGLYPGLSRGRHFARAHAHAVVGVAALHAQTTPQGVVSLHPFQCHQPAQPPLFIRGASHGRKTERGDALKSLHLGLLQPGRGRWLVGHDHSVATQQLCRIALQTRLQAISQKGHRGQGRHPQCNRHQQQTHLRRTGIAPQRAPGQGPQGLPG